jgi:hypothetical protein
MRSLLAILIAVGLVLGSCKSWVEIEPSSKVWTVAELQGLRGKTREEIRNILGKPRGLYTIDSKGRWHYPNVQVLEEGEREPRKLTVMVYFSKFGEQRSTLIEIRERFD